jgi:predicted nucleic acid-binding protein
MIVIADTTPINYLILIGQIDVLSALYGRVVIPSAVQRELLHALAPSAVRQWMEEPPAWLEVLTPRTTIDPALLKLDAGEREAIVLAEEAGADLIIVDELQGRRVAEGRGFTVIGTLGILRDAASLGLLDLDSTLNRLSETSFHLSPAILDRLRDKQS